MHELYWDCRGAVDLILLDENPAEIPEWISEVIVMPFVKGDAPSEHDFHPLRPAA